MTPFDEGAQARRENKPLLPVPYKRCSAEGKAWWKGWTEESSRMILRPEDVARLNAGLQGPPDSEESWEATEALITARVADTRRAIESNAETVEALDIMRLTLMDMAEVGW